MTITTAMLNHPITTKLSCPKHVKSRAVLSCAFGRELCSCCCFVRTAQPCLVNDFRRMAWSIRSSIDGGGFDPAPGNGTSGGTRLIRAIQAIQTKLAARVQELRKDLPMKLLFFLAGFYCATGFFTCWFFV